jgi:hypothetical protein
MEEKVTKLLLNRERQHTVITEVGELIQTQLRIVERERDTADAQDPTVERKRELLCSLQGWAAPVLRSWRARSSRDHSPAADNSAPTLG